MLEGPAAARTHPRARSCIIKDSGKTRQDEIMEELSIRRGSLVPCTRGKESSTGPREPRAAETWLRACVRDVGTAPHACIPTCLQSDSQHCTLAHPCVVPYTRRILSKCTSTRLIGQDAGNNANTRRRGGNNTCTSERNAGAAQTHLSKCAV